MEIKQAVILAGGRGLRLKPLTDENPKPMVLVNGRPFLEHLINMLKENGVEEVVILLGYLGEKIKEHFGDGSKFGGRIKYSFTPFYGKNRDEQESGLRMKNAEGLLDDFFLLLYCDNYWPLQLEKLKNFYINRKTDVSVVVYANKDKSTKNNILVDNKGYVVKYDRSRKEKNLNGVEIGFFIINKQVLKLLPEGNSHFEKDILPQLISQKKVSGYITEHKYYSISDLERLKSVEKFLLPKKTVLLDRDGVINEKPAKADYVKKWEEFRFLAGVIEAVKLFSQNGFDVCIISNQPGVARGMMTEKSLELINQKMVKEIEKGGGKIKGIYYCLHGWDDGCECRKPKPGLLFQAARENYLDLTKAVFIGDDERDMEAGNSAGCKTILLGEKNLLEIAKKLIKNT